MPKRHDFSSENFSNYKVKKFNYFMDYKKKLEIRRRIKLEWVCFYAMQKCILDCIHYVSVQIPIEIYFQPVQVSSLHHNGFQAKKKVSM